jgi:hypothetical protein
VAFDPSAVPDGNMGEGHLDDIPIYRLFLQLQTQEETGRLTVHNASGDNHLFFMRGNPVGIQLAEFFHPFGQFLLEMGRIDGATFLRAQRRISDGKRLPGQVFMEMGVLNESALKEVLVMQARRKIKQFCNLGSRPFSFGRGLTFLSGFNATPLNMHAVIYLAISQHLGPESINSWREKNKDKDIRCPIDREPLPTDLSAFEFGAPEERFLLRLKDGWNNLSDLLQTGTLPDAEVIILLRFLEIIGNLETRDPIEALPPAPEPAPAQHQAQPQAEDSVFSSEPQNAATENSEAKSSHRKVHPNAPTDVKAVDKKPQPRPVSNKPVQVQSLLTQPDAPTPPPRRKKKKKRKNPLPSVSDSAVSSVRKENTVIGKPPSIVINTDE